MHRFKELTVWQKAVDLAVEIYQVTKKFPSDERFGLISQINRCGVSVPSNIAEGTGRNSDLDFARFIGMAYGSLMEVLTQLEIANRLEYINKEQADKLRTSAAQITKMLSGLRNRLKPSKP